MNAENVEKTEQTQIIPVGIEGETKISYLKYAVFVITHRALPNVKDGLKPVLRRIFVALHNMGLTHDKPFRKAVRLVGDVMGKYHPYGDSSIYLALVRLAQKWSLRYPLIDGQGNFGSIDGDEPAAMRYTEARLGPLAQDGLLADLSEEVVPYQPNFDNSLKEPEVLPSALPNLIVNGSVGIAVGMATKMAPHNLLEAARAIKAYIDNNDISIEEIMTYIIAPDFPTGGIICGIKGVRDAFETGRGRIVLRAKAEIEVTPQGRHQIIVTEIPYMVNKSILVKKTADLIQDEVIKGIADLRDESDKDGIRVVYDLKKEAVPNVVLNTLYQLTELQISFSVNNVALVNGTPKTLNIKDLIHYYVEHRHEVITKRTVAQERKAQQQKHLLEGYLLVADHINDIVELIKTSADAQAAKQALAERYALSEIQTKAVLDMRLQRLTNLEREKIVQQYKDVATLIEKLQEILADKQSRMQIIKDELDSLCKRYQDERRTRVDLHAADLVTEDLIPNQTMVITLSQQGYIRAIPLSNYRIQNRGGIGAKGIRTKKEDMIDQLLIASAHDYLLIFTVLGKVFWKKVYELPQGSKITQGRAVQNLLEIEPNDSVCSILAVKKLQDDNYIQNKYITFVTERGIVKKVALEAFKKPHRRGIWAISFNEGDRLVEAQITQEDHYIIIALQSGRAIRFAQDQIRPMGRKARGVRGITRAGKEDKVIGMVSTPAKRENTLLVLSEKGFGKRSTIESYRITLRGGKGVKALELSSKEGTTNKLIAIKVVTEQDEIIIMNTSGITLRTEVSSIRVQNRVTQGVRILRLRNDDRIASIAIIRKIEDMQPLEA